MSSSYDCQCFKEAAVKEVMTGFIAKPIDVHVLYEELIHKLKEMDGTATYYRYLYKTISVYREYVLNSARTAWRLRYRKIQPSTY